uniref:Cation-transporting P-type ATPase N-terminal domain-containing protein n=1 Tax=Fagus sylvatica TaxID=28930 RepID=A0A2N9ENL8_FAGSY
MEDAYARSVTEVLDFFRVEPRKGLSEDQVVQHGRIYGKNGTFSVPNIHSDIFSTNSDTLTCSDECYLDVLLYQSGRM